MTLDELCAVTRQTPNDLERWAQLGAFGPRWKESRDRGKWRHITKEVAHRAIIMERLVAIGVDEERAAPVAASHVKADSKEPLYTSMRGVTVTVHRGDLDLP